MQRDKPLPHTKHAYGHRMEGENLSKGECCMCVDRNNARINVYGGKRRGVRLPGFTAASSGTPWACDMMGVEEIHRRGYTGKGVIVAVLDTGCATDHPYMKGSILSGMNLTGDYGGDPRNFTDNNSHGTHIAGIISARKNPLNGMYGIAPDARLIIYKVLEGDGGGDVGPIVRAINSAIAYRGEKGERVSVISMSFGTPKDYAILRYAIKRAAQSGILLVTAAGNEGDNDNTTSEISYPGYYPHVIQVGAMDKDKKIPPFSNANRNVDLVAPGVSVLSLGLNKDYTVMTGTSMAAPHISGAAAVIIEMYRKRYGTSPSPSRIYSILCSSTENLGYPQRLQGRGMFTFSRLLL